MFSINLFNYYNFIFISLYSIIAKKKLYLISTNPFKKLKLQFFFFFKFYQNRYKITDKTNDYRKKNMDRTNFNYFKPAKYVVHYNQKYPQANAFKSDSNESGDSCFLATLTLISKIPMPLLCSHSNH